MEITTTLPAPSSSFPKIQNIFRILVVVIFLIRWSYLNVEQKDYCNNLALNNILECMKVIIFEYKSYYSRNAHDDFDYREIITNSIMWIIGQCVQFVQVWLPRLAASFLTSFLGICFGYVGLVHLGLIQTN